MNGADMKNFIDVGSAVASARIGEDELFVSELDESDGSIALFEPRVAVMNNISLDHKSLQTSCALSFAISLPRRRRWCCIPR